MATINHIDGAEKVLQALGYWPAFHEAEVIGFSALRALHGEPGGTVARIAVQVRESKNVLIRFVFDGACDFDLSGFNDRNVIGSIAVSPLEAGDAGHAPGLRAEIVPLSGFGGTLRCTSAAVEEVELLAG